MLYCNGDIIVESNSKQYAIQAIASVRIFSSFKERWNKSVIDSLRDKLNYKSQLLVNKYKKEFPQDDAGDKYLNYKGTVNEKVLLDAWEEGWKIRHHSWRESEHDDYLNRFKSYLLPYYNELLKGNTISLFRGLSVTKQNLKYITRNLLHRNSWTINDEVAYDYATTDDSPNKIRMILALKCSIERTNLVLSAFTEGLWAGFGNFKSSTYANDEVVLNKSLEVENIKIYPINDYSKRVLKGNGFGKYIIDSLEGY